MTKGVPIDLSMIRWIWFGKCREPSIIPRKITFIDYYTTYSCSVTSDPFRRALKNSWFTNQNDIWKIELRFELRKLTVNDYICTMLKRFDKISAYTVLCKRWLIKENKKSIRFTILNLPAPNVLSTITGIPASCATLQISSKSGILNVGLLIDSRNMAFVLSSINLAMSSGSPSVNLTLIPHFGNVTYHGIS